jgi:signal peptidase I
MNGASIGYGQATFGAAYPAAAPTTPEQGAPPDPFARTTGYPPPFDPASYGTASPDAEPWLGSSAPTRRRDRADRANADRAGGGSRADRSGRSPGRSSSRSSGRSASRFEPTGGLGGLAQRARAGLKRERSDHGHPDAGPAEPQTTGQAVLSAVTEVVVVLSMALALSLVIKTFLVQAFFIPSQSMQDTLQVGDRVLVSKLTPGPLSLHRGDVVVFKDPGGWLDAQPDAAESPIRHALTVALTFVGLLPQDSGEHLIKRVIGMPGDTVMCCDAKGRLQVNGTPTDETYVRAGSKPSTETFTVTVKADHLWVMGDNRSQSYDSRFHRELDDGQVPTKNVVGKAFVIVWPFSRFGGVADPPTVFARVPDPPSTGAK